MRKRRLTPWRAYLQEAHNEELEREIENLETERDTTPSLYDPLKRAYRRMIKQINLEIDRRNALNTVNLHLPFKELNR